MSQQKPQESITNTTVYWTKKRKDAAGGAIFLSVVFIVIYALSAHFVGTVGLIILLFLLGILCLAVFQPESKKAQSESKKVQSRPQEDKPLYLRLQEKGPELKEEGSKIVQSRSQSYSELASVPQSPVIESEMTVYCIHCGTQLPAIASFCLKCGKPVSGTATTSVVPQSVTPISKPATTSVVTHSIAPHIETCEIVCQSSGVLGGKSFFIARALGPKGMFIAATSTKKFRSVVGGSDRSGNDWHRPDTYSWGSQPLAEAAFNEIVSMLSSDGWQPTGTGGEWWQCKFKRQVIPGSTTKVSSAVSREADENAHKLLIKATENFIAEEWQEAITVLDQLIQLPPTEAFLLYNAYILRGDAYIELEQYQKALLDINHALEIAPRSAGAYLSRGRIYKALGEKQKALVDYDYAIELDPKHGDAYKIRGYFFYELKQYQKALLDSNRAIEIHPESDTYYILRGMVYEKLGQYHKAIADFDRAIELDPELDDIKAYRQEIYDKLNNK